MVFKPCSNFKGTELEVDSVLRDVGHGLLDVGRDKVFNRVIALQISCAHHLLSLTSYCHHITVYPTSIKQCPRLAVVCSICSAYFILQQIVHK